MVHLHERSLARRDDQVTRDGNHRGLLRRRFEARENDGIGQVRTIVPGSADAHKQKVDAVFFLAFE